jgi:hypothetical protein
MASLTAMPMPMAVAKTVGRRELVEDQAVIILQEVKIRIRR